MKLASGILSLALVASVAAAVHAHFVFVMTSTDASGKVTPHVVFGEGPEPGEEYLLDNVAQTKAWLQRPGAEPQALALTKQAGEEVGSWTSDVDARGAVLFATCDYGVLDKGGKTFLLQYYAKKLDATPEQLKSLARTEQLPLDIVPALADDQGELTVLWEGKPAADCEVTITPPGEKSEKVQTNAQGVAKFSAKKSGTHVFRAKWVVAKSGERAGKAYPSQTHYSTLVLNVPAKASTK